MQEIAESEAEELNRKKQSERSETSDLPAEERTIIVADNDNYDNFVSKSWLLSTTFDFAFAKLISSLSDKRHRCTI